MSTVTISPRELYELAESGQDVEIIDVRTPVEFQEVHSTLARNVPLDQLQAKTSLVSEDLNRPLYVICRSGSRGKQARETLIKAGYANVLNVEGGTQAWAQAGLPVVRGYKVMSLERQVRIAAGLLVLIGALLSYFAHPYWIALAGFVGAGLIFAGVTDTCGMGMLLARMPWNQAAAAEGNGPGETSCATGGRC